ncbi:pilus assembly protein [Glaciimonas immobilis]|uniref:Flp pilus assembly protein TadD n=1 Tax=Glaciimonas immobilis TaxID=728004 RepID=A0A840RM90_9BURK|nr:pilus assembly protein [Glaciimonas immobilis]MBB5198212.1 Flp pilus assembly protein TadD [Glaciimonas immobilis]
MIRTYAKSPQRRCAFLAVLSYCLRRYALLGRFCVSPAVMGSLLVRFGFLAACAARSPVVFVLPKSASRLVRNYNARFLAYPLLALSLGLSGCAVDSAARLYAQQNDAAQARQEAEVQSAKPDSKGVYLGLIRKMQLQGLYFASLAHLDAYEQQYGIAPDEQRLRADAFRETRQADAADATYRKLLSTSEAAAAWHGLGLLAAQSGNYIAAVPSFVAASKREPINPVMLSDLGYALLRSGDTNGARVPLAQAAELAPDNRKIISNLTLLLVVTGEGVKASAVMDKAKLTPEARAAIYRLADSIKTSLAPAAGAAQSVKVTQPSETVQNSRSRAQASQTQARTIRPLPANATDLRTNRFESMLDRFGAGG